MNLKNREEKIIEKRRKTIFRDFIKEVASRIPLIFYKENGLISRSSQTERIWEIISAKEFEQIRNNFTKYGINYNFNKDFFWKLLWFTKTNSIYFAYGRYKCRKFRFCRSSMEIKKYLFESYCNQWMWECSVYILCTWQSKKHTE